MIFHWSSGCKVWKRGTPQNHRMLTQNGSILGFRSSVVQGESKKHSRSPKMHWYYQFGISINWNKVHNMHCIFSTLPEKPMKVLADESCVTGYRGIHFFLCLWSRLSLSDRYGLSKKEPSSGWTGSRFTFKITSAVKCTFSIVDRTDFVFR